jgi:hypothetical protein
MHLDSEVLLQPMPGWDTIKRTESKARELAFTLQEATMFVRFETIPVAGNEERGPVPVEAAAELAKAWHAILERLAQ